MQPEAIPAAGTRPLPRLCRAWAPFALALAWALAPAPASAQTQARAIQAKIAGQETLAPKWIYLRDRVTGICPDIMAAVERIEPRLRFVGARQSRSLPGLDAGLESGSLDAACALLRSPRREALAERVGPVLYVVRHRLAARSGDPAEVRSIEDLKQMNALVLGVRGGAFLDKLKAAGVRVDDSTDDNVLNLRKVLAGHGRFVEMNDMTLGGYLRDGDLARRLRILPVVMAEESAYFWVSRKADPAIAPLLGRALDRLKASGELERIHARHAAPP